MIYAIAILAPLFGSIFAGVLRAHAFGDRFAQSITIILMLIASVCGVTALFDSMSTSRRHRRRVDLANWIDIGSFPCRLGAAPGHAQRRHGGDGHLRGDADPYLQRRLHGA